MTSDDLDTRPWPRPPARRSAGAPSPRWPHGHGRRRLARLRRQHGPRRPRCPPRPAPADGRGDPARLLARGGLTAYDDAYLDARRPGRQRERGGNRVPRRRARRTGSRARGTAPSDRPAAPPAHRSAGRRATRPQPPGAPCGAPRGRAHSPDRLRPHRLRAVDPALEGHRHAVYVAPLAGPQCAGAKPLGMNDAGRRLDAAVAGRSSARDAAGARRPWWARRGRRSRGRRPRTRPRRGVRRPRRRGHRRAGDGRCRARRGGRATASSREEAGRW